MKKLGKIEKPSLEKFRHGRKLFCVPLIPYVHGNNVKKDFREKTSLYWKQAAEQVSNLEKVGQISHIYHESITSAGESAINTLRKMNKESYCLVEAKLKQGAKFEVLEDEGILDEYVDWSMCLSVIGRSQKVVSKIIDFHGKVVRKRHAHIAKKIDQTLMDDEAGLLIMVDENRIHLQPNLPSDIQIFLVHPPAFNDVQRLFREQLLRDFRKPEDG